MNNKLMKKRGTPSRRDVFILIIFLLVSGLITVCNYNNSPPKKLTSINNKVKNELKTLENVNYIVGYDIINSVYTQINDDPQISYVGIEDEISYIQISFSNKMVQDTFVQVYYRGNNEELSESKSVISWIKKGDASIVINLPKGIYAELRIDINGNFESPVVDVSGGGVVEYRNVYDGVFYIIFIDLLFIIIWACALRCGKIDFICRYIKNMYLKLTEHKLAVLFVFIGIVSFAFFIAHIADEDYFWFRSAFALSILFVAVAIIRFKGKPEKLFLVISLISGLFLSSVLPISLVSWDEDSHYPWAVEWSFLKTVYFTQAETDIRSITKEEWFNTTNRITQISEKDKQYRDGFNGDYSKNWKSYLKLYGQVGHMPAGIMLFMARSFNFPFHLYFIFGKMGNVLVYSLVIYFALRRLKSEKYILSTIALFPTCVFLAANYSYDYWVNAFTALGIAYFFRELQEPDKKSEVKNIFIMICAFVLALGPKPIYFPLMIMLYMLKEDKFADQGAYRKYLLAVTLSLLFVVMSFVAPFLYSKGMSHNDLRGGPGVNSAGQVKFILSNPIDYMVILLKFLKGYLSLDNIKNYTNFFAYLGYAPNFFLLLVTSGVALLTDKNQYDEIVSGLKVKAIALCIAFVSIALVATALYIAFTPVAANTILGCQPRYIIPVLFLVLPVIGSSKIRNQIHEDLYSTLIFGSLSYVLFFGIWTLVISKYN